MFQSAEQEEDFLKLFKESSCLQQRQFLQTLLQESHPEVKYHVQVHIGDITKYDVISEVPLEIAQRILLYLDLSALLNCRQVSRCWRYRVNNFDQVWQPYLKMYCINQHGFQFNEECWRAINKRNRGRSKEEQKKDDESDHIGDRLFKLAPISDDLEAGRCDFKYKLYSTGAKSFILGRKLVNILRKQARFECIIDQDSRGSNVVMAMDSQIIAYAREDRHIVVKYTNFPHKKICVFEAHQCADLKIYDDCLITGGYDRTICIWEWATGTLLKSLEGSLKPVYSLDVWDDILISSDGKSVITWDLQTFRMLFKSQCFDHGIVEELKIVDQNACKRLHDMYNDFIVIIRSSKQIQVSTCSGTGVITRLTYLEFDREINNLQPFIQVHEHIVACSSDHGIIAWSLLDFTVENFIERDPCHACLFGVRSAIFPRANNCRVIMLYYSSTLLLQYFVHKNKFQLLGSNTRIRSKSELAWDFPSDETWPWSHRKPGLASLVLNMDSGFSMNTKITLFVGTQGKKIYCMLFDASDLNYSLETLCLDSTPINETDESHAPWSLSDRGLLSYYLKQS